MDKWLDKQLRRTEKEENIKFKRKFGKKKIKKRYKNNWKKKL